MPKRPGWERLSDDRLLGLRFCDLRLRIDQPSLAKPIARLYDELDQRGLKHFKPHCWISTEWFSPDGVPGIAIPFYLAHPRLLALEQSQMLEAEGASEVQRMRIFRHEAGHAIDTAYRLHRKARWRELFGSYAQPYPESYTPRPGSRRFVVHLPSWYAQAHPAEDFAETFAVWLTPRSQWRTTFKGWPALRKLEYVDELMRDIADRLPPVRSRRFVEPLSDNTTTLREHYHDKKLYYADEFPDFFDSDLRKLFSDDPRFAKRQSAASFLRAIRPQLRDDVSRWTGTHAYTLDQVLRDMIDRCKELNLRLAVPKRQAAREAPLLVTVNTVNFIHAGHRPVAL